MQNISQKKLSLWRSVLLTSLPAYILAEFFFASIYYLIVQGTQFIYIVGSSFSTAIVEANMQIFGVFNITVSLFSIILISIVTCVEIATIISIPLYDYYRDDHIPFRSLLKFSYQNVRSLCSWKGAPLFILVLLFPKEHIGPKGILSLNIPNFIVDEVLKNPVIIPIIFVIVLLFGYILYRSLFFIHAMLLGRVGVFASLKQSFQITKKIGFFEMFRMFLRTGIWIVFFSFPLFIGIFAIERLFLSVSFFGVFSPLFATITSWFLEFLMIGLLSVMLLASLTITYIQHIFLDKENMEEYFPFLSENRKDVPRWKNLRTIFSRKVSVCILASILVISGGIIFLNIKIAYQSVLQPVEIIAHRGDLTHSGTPFVENTIESIENAIRHGATIVEIDVYQNKDKTIILSHDPNIARISGINKNIADLSDAEMSAIQLPGGSHIPTLEEVLLLAHKQNIRLLIEPKLHGKETQFPEGLIALISKTQMESLVVMHSLNLDILLDIKKLSPNLRVGYIAFGGIGNFGALPVDFFSLQETLITDELITQIHYYKKQVYIWTINDTSEAQYAIYNGIDGVITDTPNDIAELYTTMKRNIMSHPRQILSFFGYNIDIPSPF